MIRFCINIHYATAFHRCKHIFCPKICISCLLQFFIFFFTLCHKICTNHRCFSNFIWCFSSIIQSSLSKSMRKLHTAKFIHMESFGYLRQKSSVSFCVSAVQKSKFCRSFSREPALSQCVNRNVATNRMPMIHVPALTFLASPVKTWITIYEITPKAMP